MARVEVPSFFTKQQCKELGKRLAPIMEDILKQHIQEDIYDAYEPKKNGWVKWNGHSWIRATYERRGELGDKVKSVTKYQGNGAVVNTTSYAKARKSILNDPPEEIPSQAGGFLWAIENGFDGKGGWGLWKGGRARKALSNAQKELDKSTKLQEKANEIITQMLSGKKNT